MSIGFVDKKGQREFVKKCGEEESGAEWWQEFGGWMRVREVGEMEAVGNYLETLQH